MNSLQGAVSHATNHLMRKSNRKNEFVDNGAPPNGAFFTRGRGVDGREFSRAHQCDNRQGAPETRRRLWHNINDPESGGTRASATDGHRVDRSEQRHGVCYVTEAKKKGVPAGWAVAGGEVGRQQDEPNAGPLEQAARKVAKRAM